MQIAPNNFPIVKLLVNHPRWTVCEGLLASLQPAMRPPNLNFQWRVEGRTIQLQTSPWGDIGFIKLENNSPTQVEIQFFLSPFPSPAETEQVEGAIRSEILKNLRTMADLNNNLEGALQILAEHLYDQKKVLLVKIRDWLAGALGIWALI